ncbi:MAG: HAMP domain-containing histidine kinase [Chloroflexi bacterium]|nr:HAMP domain-containing histidine kinase [Chloroflexota bacterium]
MGSERKTAARIGGRVTAYVVGTACLAVFALAFAFWLEGAPGASVWLWGAVLCLVVLLAQGFPVHWSPRRRADISTAPLFAGALLLPIPVAMLAGAVAAVASGVWRRGPPAETVFSAGAVVLNVGPAALLFHRLAPGGLVAAAGSGPGLVAVMAAAGAFYLANTSVVAGIVSVQLDRGFAPVWLDMHRQVGAVEVVLFALGFLAALLAMSEPWALALVAVPLGLSYHLLQGVAQKAALSNTLEQQLKQLKAYEAELVQAAKLSSVGTLASGVAHEINNPLFVIMGRAEMLLQCADTYFKTDKAKQHVEVIHDMGKRIEGIVGSLLGYSRCREEAGPVDLNDAAEEVLLLVEHELRTHEVSVATEWSARPPLVWGNRSELQQVCMNLVINAKDAMPEGGSLTLRTAAVNGNVSLAVADSGVGMTRETIGHLFEPFYTTKEPGKGTGLGLYLSQRIVERHHGHIAVTSEIGQGTQFEVVLPRLATEDSTLAPVSGSDSLHLVRS